MKSAISLFALIATILFSSSFSTYKSAGQAWMKLGSKKVNYTIEKDVIHVGPNDGTFKKLKILVTGGSLSMHRMVVEYGNGTKDKIALKQLFKRGSDSRVIDLQGGKRIIKDITFWYDTKKSSRNRATVHVFGRK